MLNFEDIDRRRVENGFSRKAVYERAGVHKETWRRLHDSRTSPTTRTLEKLADALDQLIDERRSGHD